MSVDIETHVRVARQHHGTGDLYAARAELEAAQSLKPAGRDLVHVLITRGIVNREIGDTTAAIDDLQQCIGLLPDYPDLAGVMLGPAWYNLGLALRQSKRLPESIDAYGVAISLFRADGMTDHLRMALQNRAWAYCIIGDTQAAGIDLAESAPFCSTACARSQQRIGEAFHLMLTGAHDEATRICTDLADDREAPGDVVSHAFWLAGRMLLAAGAVDSAEVLAVQAVHRATQASGENRTLADASELLSQVRKLKRGGVSA